LYCIKNEMKNSLTNILLSILFLLLVISCSEENKNDVSLQERNQINLPLEELAKRHVEAHLNISSNEKYTLSIHKKHLDEDNIVDAIILVNRLNFALDEAEKSNNNAKRAHLGFTGRYNFLFYYEGGLKKFSPVIPVPSSPHALLKLNFTSFSGKKYSDFTIDYTIRNSQFRNYYIIQNHTPVRVFQWKIYDYLLEDNEEVNFLTFDNGSYSKVKDILIYEGKISNHDEIKDIYHFDPKIEKITKEPKHRFFFLDDQFKYFTNK